MTWVQREARTPFPESTSPDYRGCLDVLIATIAEMRETAPDVIGAHASQRAFAAIAAAEDRAADCAGMLFDRWIEVLTPNPFAVNGDILAAFLTEREFEEFIAYRPGPHFLRPDFGIGEPDDNAAIDFFDVGRPWTNIAEHDPSQPFIVLAGADRERMLEFGWFDIGEPLPERAETVCSGPNWNGWR